MGKKRIDGGGQRPYTKHISGVNFKYNIFHYRAKYSGGNMNYGTKLV